MISPGQIPTISGDMDALADHAAAIGRTGADFADTGERVDATWQGLAAVYDAPETGQLLAGTGPIRTVSASVGEDLTTVGTALATYAAEVRGIQAQLEALRAQATTFVDSVSGDPDWQADAGRLESHNALLAAVDAQVAAFEEAQRRCAGTINALHGGQRPVQGDSGPPDDADPSIWDQVGGFVEGVGSGIEDAGELLGEGVGDLGSFLGDSIGGVAGAVADGAGGIVGQVVEGVGGVIGAGVEGAGGIVGAVDDGVGAVLGEAVDSAAGVAGEVAEGAGGLLGAAVAGVGGVLGAIGDTGPVKVTPGTPLPHNPLDLVPDDAHERELTPHPGQGAQYGVEYKWVQDGQTIRVRVHGPDGTAPDGSNAASGVTYRVQIGQRYLDQNGNLYPSQVHNPRSPNYNPEAADDTHITWPADVPYPWE